jgi:DNA-binding beta-propeller fold protein YncE
LSLKVLTRPAGATIKVRTEKGQVNSGQSPFVKRLPAGKVKLEISKKGFNTIKKSFFLEENTSLSFFLDPEGQILHCLNIFKCGGSPKGVAFAPGRKEVWVTLLGNRPAVRVFEPLSGEKLADIYLGKSGAVEITFLSDGSKAYISQMETAQVYEVETRNRQILRTFKTGSAWSKVVALSKDEKTLFVSNWSGNDVSEIDLTSGKLRRRLPTVKTPRGLFPTPDGKFLYVAGFGKGEIDLINLLSGKGKVIFSQGGAVRHLVADPKRKILFASDLGEDCIWKVYLDSNRVEKFARTDHKPNTIDLTPDGKLLFVSCRGANNPKSYYLPGPEWGSVLVFDTQTGKPVDAVVGGNQCTALDVSPDGKLLIFSDFLDGTLRLYEIPPYEEFQKGKGGYYRAHLAKLSK